VSENRVLRRIFGLKREEVAGGWRNKWEGNIRMSLREIGWEVVDTNHLAPDMDQ
jgi:hypothetical protein